MIQDNDRLRKQIDFILEIDKLKNVFRQTHLSNNGRRENVAEHSWHMAMMVFILKEHSNVDIDTCKVIMMCLIHDIVEIIAGDTYAYDESDVATQKQREDEAKEILFGMLPKDQKKTLIGLFDEFEAAETPEAKFARSIDNFQPVLLNNSNEGKDWVEHGVHKDQVYKRQALSKEGSETLYNYTLDIIEKHTKIGNLLAD